MAMSDEDGVQVQRNAVGTFVPMPGASDIGIARGRLFDISGELIVDLD